MKMETWDVFISHASEDKEYIVEPLVRVLEQNGISCWYDKRNIGWGDSLIDSISDGLNKSEYVLVVLSQTFVAKGWTNAELNSMLSTEISSEDKKVLPLIVAGEEYILNKFPLLKDKKYLVWNGHSKHIVDELKKVLGRESDSLLESELSKIRQKLFTSHTIHELKKLLYGIEEYQSIYPSSIDAKILKDTVNEAILKTDKFCFKPTLNIKKIIYITSSVILFVIFSFSFLIQKGTDINEIRYKIDVNKDIKYRLRIETIPIDAQIRIVNTRVKYRDNIMLKKGVYRIEVSKKGYAVKRFDLLLEENTVKTIKLDKDKDVMYQNFNLTKKYTWKESNEYCQNFVRDGHNNWKLPSKSEIFKLNKIYFPTERENREIILWTSDCSKSEDTCIGVYYGNRYSGLREFFHFLSEERHSVICVKEK